MIASASPEVQRLKVAIQPLDLPYSGPVTHSGEILTTGKCHGKIVSSFIFFLRSADFVKIHKPTSM